MEKNSMVVLPHNNLVKQKTRTSDFLIRQETGLALKMWGWSTYAATLGMITAYMQTNRCQINLLKMPTKPRQDQKI